MSKKRQRERELSPKQKRFCLEYIKNHANAAKAYELAGYTNKSPRNGAQQLKAKPEVQAYIAELAKGVDQSAVADADEVMRYLTEVMRGQHESSLLVTVGTGKGKTQAISVPKKPDEKEQLEAAKTLAKIHGLLTNKLELSGGAVVQIVDDIPEGGDLEGFMPDMEDPDGQADGDIND